MVMSRISFWLMAVLSIGVAIASYRFVMVGLDVAFDIFPQHLELRRTMLFLHVALAPVALFLGVFQFMRGLRARFPAAHRWAGRIYAIAILVSGLAGLALAAGAFAYKPIAGVGFGLLALVWIATTAQAVRLARARHFAAHRIWMIRSFALTFAAVTLRLQLPFLIAGFDLDYDSASNIVSWSCWVPNLLFAEWFVRRKS